MSSLVCSCHVLPGRCGRSHGICRRGAAPAAARASPGDHRVVDGRCQRRHPAGAAPAPSGAAGGPAGRRDQPGNARRARRGVPGSTARRLGRGGGRARTRRPWSSTAVPTSGWTTRTRGSSTTGPTTPAPGPTGCPSSRPAGQAGRCAADRRTRVLSDDGDARPAARHHPAADRCRGRRGRGGQRHPPAPVAR